jgi:exodeoxyribonuclease V alpha subunit
VDHQVFEAWAHSVLTAFERFRLLCAVREGKWGTVGLNLAVERALIAEGLLVRRGEWYEGRPVMVTRNDPGIGVFNGDIGIVMKPFDAGAPLRAYFLDGASVRSVGVSRLANVDTAFAMTVHKSQGSEFEHTVLVLPQEPSRVLTRELVYTGITRARKSFTLVTGRAQALADALSHQTRRSSGLIDRLKGG